MSREPLIQYRVLWLESIGGQMIAFSGMVRTSFEFTEAEAKFKRAEPYYLGVMIEARIASDEAWPRPWDEAKPAQEGLQRADPA